MDMEYLLTSGTWTWGDWDRDGKVGDEDTDGESVTAKQFFSKSGGSEESWKAWLDDYKVGNYHFKDTSEGRSEIVNKLLESGSFTLGSGDKDNFDYLFGDGAYDAIKEFEFQIGDIQYGHDPQEDKDNFYGIYQTLMRNYDFNEDVLDKIVQTRYPDLWNFMFPSEE